MRIKITISLIWTVIALFAFFFGRLARDYTAERHIEAQQEYITEIENRMITEQMISIQRQLGCKILDGKVGPEMTPLVNAKVDEEKPEYLNKCAIKIMERMAKGDKK